MNADNFIFNISSQLIAQIDKNTSQSDIEKILFQLIFRSETLFPNIPTLEVEPPVEPPVEPTVKPTTTKRKNKKKTAQPLINLLDNFTPPTHQLGLSYEYRPITIHLNSFGNYEHLFTNFVFKQDSDTGFKVIGKQEEDGSISLLSTNDKQMCCDYGWVCD
jgi:hypothetical protein